MSRKTIKYWNKVKPWVWLVLVCSGVWLLVLGGVWLWQWMGRD